MKSKGIVAEAAFIFAIAAVLTFLLHFWRLPGFLSGLLPVARGTVAFFLGGAAFDMAWRLKNDSAPRSHSLRAGLLAFTMLWLLIVYSIPIYCGYLHTRRDLEHRSASGQQTQMLVAIQSGGFPAYLRSVGQSALPVSPDDLPEGEGLFDIIIIIAHGVDQGLQRLCISVLHLPIAGYVSLALWYFVFVGISHAGSELLWRRV